MVFDGKKEVRDVIKLHVSPYQRKVFTILKKMGKKITV